MKTHILATALSAALCFGSAHGGACSNRSSAPRHSSADAAFETLVPNFLSLPVTDIDGKPIDIADQPGWKVVYFWSAECPCVTACEDYTLKPLAAKYAGKVSFYAIAANGYDLQKPVSELRKEIDGHKLPYPVLLDRSHAAAKALDALVTPEVFVLNPDNRVVYSGMPDDSKRYLKLTGKHGVTETYLSRALDEALAGKPVSQAHTQLEGCLIAW